MKRIVLIVLLVAAVVVGALALAGGWARWLVPGGGLLHPKPHADSSMDTFPIAAGENIVEGTIVGLHVDLGDAWTSTA